MPLPTIHGHPLVFIRSTMTARLYVHDILQPHVLPLMHQLPGAIFQEDNTRPPTARHIWDHLGRRAGHLRSLYEQEERSNCSENRDCGLSYHSIAAYVDRDPMTVSRIWNLWVQDGNTERRAGSQRPLTLAAKKTVMLPTWP
ncbi:transposable element Tcb2 transposase [Trichonephila clavipes]|uniref:Transposable element Tcb2 transposase n=1 Tax=Trichonephila clavipes TaxID=2585209 RepID=A0A8X6S5P0_TRICX|nr:transposable element Tcb2 transposase [Trichonephila clavipes]